MPHKPDITAKLRAFELNAELRGDRKAWKEITLKKYHIEEFLKLLFGTILEPQKLVGSLHRLSMSVMILAPNG